MQVGLNSFCDPGHIDADPPTRSTQSVRLTLARTELEIQSIQANRANQPGQTHPVDPERALTGMASESIITKLVLHLVHEPAEAPDFEELIQPGGLNR